MSSVIEVFRGNAKDNGITSRDLSLNLGNVLSSRRRERAVARNPANICWQVDFSCRPMGSSGNIIMDNVKIWPHGRQHQELRRNHQPGQ